MQESKISPSNFPYVFGGVFIFVSLILLTVAISMGYKTINTKFNFDAYATATHIEINSYLSKDSDGHSTTMYSPIFFYNVDGNEYSCSTSISSSSKPNINNNKIFYDSKNPEYCINEYDYKQAIFLIVIMTIIAFPQLIVGLCVLIPAINKSAKIKRLKQRGQLIKDIPCVVIPTIFTYNNKQGYIIELEYEGVKYKSEVKYDIDARRTTADLLIDPLNSKDYFIDFDILHEERNLSL